MKHTKRMAALLLCLALAVSLLSVGVSAEFSDQSEIKNTGAVDLCVNLGVLDGYIDNSFQPEGNIRRSEAAKMISVVLNGGQITGLSAKTVATFRDVRGDAAASWAEGHIEYCVDAGVVSGVGRGIFNPNGNVTGTQFAKMLLVSLGYDAANENFLGTNWMANVNTVAQRVGLYADLGRVDISAALRRDDAAQMIYNALFAQVERVYVDGQWQTVYGNYTLMDTYFTYGAEAATIPPQLLLGMENAEGILVSSYQVQDDFGKITSYHILADYDQEGQLVVTHVIEGSGDYTAFMGQRCRIWYKEKSNQVYGVYPADNAAAIPANRADIGVQENKYILGGLEFEGNPQQAVLVVNYNTGLAVGDPVVLGPLDAAHLPYAPISALRSDEVMSGYTLIDNDADGKVELIVQQPASLGRVESVVTSGQDPRITVKDLTSGYTNTYLLEYTNMNDDELAKDDYVRVVDGNRTFDGMDSMEKLETMRNVVERVNLTEGKVVLNDEIYQVTRTVDLTNVSPGESASYTVWNDAIVWIEMEHNLGIVTAVWPVAGTEPQQYKVTLAARNSHTEIGTFVADKDYSSCLGLLCSYTTKTNALEKLEPLGETLKAGVAYESWRVDLYNQIEEKTSPLSSSPTIWVVDTGIVLSGESYGTPTALVLVPGDGVNDCTWNTVEQIRKEGVGNGYTYSFIDNTGDDKVDLILCTPIPPAQG